MVWEIALVVLLVALSVLVILIIPAVLNLMKTLSKLSDTLDTVNKELPDILADVSEITYQASKTSERLHDAVDDIAQLERRVAHHVKEPMLEVAASLGGFLRALQAFLTYFVKKEK